MAVAARAMPPADQHTAHSILGLLLLSVLIIATPSTCAATDTVSVVHPLVGGDKIVSSNSKFALGFFHTTGGNNTTSTTVSVLKWYLGVWFHTVPKQTPAWVANRGNPIVDGASSSELMIWEDGNLVIFNHANQSVVWSSQVNTTTNNTVAVLLSSGNVFWESFEHMTDTFLPGGKMGGNKVTGLVYGLVSNKNSIDLAPGVYSAQPSSELTNKQMLLSWNSSVTYWSSGSWNGQYLGNMPQMSGGALFTYEVVSNDKEHYFTYRLKNDTLITRYVLDVSGQAMNMIWSDSSEDWLTFYAEPEAQCDVYAPRCFRKFFLVNWIKRDGNGNGNTVIVDAASAGLSQRRLDELQTRKRECPSPLPTLDHRYLSTGRADFHPLSTVLMPTLPTLVDHGQENTAARGRPRLEPSLTNHPNHHIACAHMNLPQLARKSICLRSHCLTLLVYFVVVDLSRIHGRYALSWEERRRPGSWDRACPRLERRLSPVQRLDKSGGLNATGSFISGTFLEMKRPQWSHPSIALPLLVALFLLLTFRCSLLHGQAPFLRVADAPADDVDDATLAELSAVDPAASAVLRAAEALLAGNLTRSPPELRDAALRGLRGWLERQRFDPGVMSELVDLVKRPIDGGRPRPYASCAVVGNSGILLAREHGALIDGHDLVVRLNNAPAGEGRFARHVGAKTGLAFVNSNVLSRCAAPRTGGCRYCHPYGERVPILTYMCNAAHFVEHAACSTGEGAPVIVTDPRLDVLCARIVKYYSLRRFARETGRPATEWGTRHEEGMFHYSSGMQAVVAALGVCGKVSVFGFGKEPGARHHYHTLQRGELDLHDYEAEYEFYRDLEARPEAIPFLRDSGFRLPPVVVYRQLPLWVCPGPCR
nr:unnamed protein product [Digitaria exilis]